MKTCNSQWASRHGIVMNCRYVEMSENTVMYTKSESIHGTDMYMGYVNICI